MKHEIFLLDTNVLYEIITLYSPEPSSLAKKIDGFLKGRKLVYIPDIVWTEFTASIFQKKIDYSDYNSWHQRVLSSYLHVYQYLLEHKVRDYKTSGIASVVNIDFIGLARDFAFIRPEDDFIQSLVGETSQKLQAALAQENPDPATLEFIERQRHNLASGKLMDGCDTMILASAIVFAIQRADSRVILLSNDRWMGRVANHLLQNLNKYGLEDLKNRSFSLTVENPKNFRF